MCMKTSKKKVQLGIDPGTASSVLKKMIMFDLIKRLNLNVCFQCGNIIDTVDELSIEHKIPWLDSDNPYELFFDLNNIAFSHLKCNTSAARKRLVKTHPSVSAYRNGCRCAECKNIEKLRRRSQRKRGIKT